MKRAIVVIAALVVEGVEVTIVAIPTLFLLAACVGEATGWYRIENYVTTGDH